MWDNSGMRPMETSTAIASRGKNHPRTLIGLIVVCMMAGCSHGATLQSQGVPPEAAAPLPPSPSAEVPPSPPVAPTSPTAEPQTVVVPPTEPQLQGIQRLLQVEVEASSTRKGGVRYKDRFAARKVFDEVPGWPDGGFLTGWCEGKKGVSTGETLTIRFAQPTNVGRISFQFGQPAGKTNSNDALGLYPDGLAPDDTGIEVRLDGNAALPLHETSTESPDLKTMLVADSGKTLVTTVTFTITDTSSDVHHCISEILFSERTAVLTKGFDKPLSAGLEKLAAKTRDGFASCDPAWAKALRFPIDTLSSDSSSGYSGNLRTTLKSKKALLESCSTAGWNVPPEDDRLFASAKVLTPYPGPKRGSVMVYLGQMEDDLETWVLGLFVHTKKGWRLSEFYYLADRGVHAPE